MDEFTARELSLMEKAFDAARSIYNKGSLYDVYDWLNDIAADGGVTVSMIVDKTASGAHKKHRKVTGK